MNTNFRWRGAVALLTLLFGASSAIAQDKPNIDRIASEGALFTDWYGQQSCTAGRAAFLTGQSPIRTGLLKAYGYMTAQYGKNHLGDLDEHLPTNHGFDEFLGNLYHLNAEEEPENPDYPKNAEFKKKFGPRGVIRAEAGGEIVDTGPLTKKRMETIDVEVTDGALDFIDRAHDSGKPFFLWWNSAMAACGFGTGNNCFATAAN